MPDHNPEVSSQSPAAAPQPNWWEYETPAWRANRTFQKADIEAMPWLPERVTPDALRRYGMINVLHTRRETAPCLPAGFYKTTKAQWATRIDTASAGDPRKEDRLREVAGVPDARLYVIEVWPSVKGEEPATQVYQPIIRLTTGVDQSAEYVSPDGLPF